MVGQQTRSSREKRRGSSKDKRQQPTTETTTKRCRFLHGRCWAFFVKRKPFFFLFFFQFLHDQGEKRRKMVRFTPSLSLSSFVLVSDVVVHHVLIVFVWIDEEEQHRIEEEGPPERGR